MTATPLWVPLLVAVVGVVGTIVGTIAGVIITQRRSDRRETTTWERERTRERERWDREDALRNFEVRRDAYVGFYVSLGEMSRMVCDYGMGFSPEPPVTDPSPVLEDFKPDWYLPAFRSLQHLRVFASAQVLEAADHAYLACLDWGQTTRWQTFKDSFRTREQEYDRAELIFRDVMRRDLGVERSVDRPFGGQHA